MNKTDEIVLQFSTSLEWQSTIIRRLTHSPFSHCDIAMPDGLFGASDPGGVKMRPYDYQPWGARAIARIKTDKAQLFHEAVLAEDGKPFDGGALYAFLAEHSRDFRDESKWYCSELIVAKLEQVGFFPYRLLIPKNRVSPADLLLLLNPYIDTEAFELPVSLRLAL